MIAIISCCGSNIASVQYALQRIGVESILTTDSNTIKKASHVILPGVGHAQYAMNHLKDHGLVTTLKNLKQPVLGICLGMQLLYAFSEEGNVECLNIIPEHIKKLPSAEGLTIPHMGWNTLAYSQASAPLLKDLNEDENLYFVHSYFAPISAATITATKHGVTFSAMVQQDNFFGMQFHPEKSGRAGEILLTNFIKS